MTICDRHDYAFGRPRYAVSQVEREGEDVTGVCL